MNIAIIDDLQEERKLFKKIVSQYITLHSLDIQMIEFSSGEEFVSSYQAFQYSAIFMDIFMNNMTGIEAAKKIRKTDQNTPLIFLTASNEHMPDAFIVHAYDYIQKPLNKTRIFQTLDDILNLTIGTENRLTFSWNEGIRSIPFGDIVMARSQGHCTEITLQEGMAFSPRINFSTITDTLGCDQRFLVLIRGVLVNMDYIINFHDGSCYLEGKICLPVNVRNRKKIEQIWKNYIFDKIRNDTKRKAVNLV